MDLGEALRTIEELKLRNRVLMGMQLIGDDASFRARLCGVLAVGLRSQRTLHDLLIEYDELMQERERSK